MSLLHISVWEERIDWNVIKLDYVSNINSSYNNNNTCNICVMF